MENKILFTEDDYTIKQHSGIPKQAIDFFERTAWGSEGAVYENKNTKNHINLLHKPMLLAIHEKEKIQGTAVFCNTPVTVYNKPFNCNYVKYFASSKEIRGKGVMKRFSIEIMTLIRNNEAAKTIYFACIERANKGSYRVVESAGYTNVGTVKTVGFSRFFPKKNVAVEQITSKKDQNTVLELLKKTYKSHALVQFNSIFMKDNYYVIRENNEIVAGCQYHRGHWVINKMAGLIGKFVMNIVPIIPLLNQIFNPKRFEFLTFEGIYFKNGHEDKLHTLFEHLLAKEELKSAMYWMAATCPIRAKIEKAGQQGLIHAFIKDNDVIVMAAFENMSEAEIQAVHEQPLFASGFDYT
jgi:RimJ/RimL family protein N-acetyltransferase